MTIFLQPIGSIDEGVLGFLKRRLSAIWPTRLMSPIGPPSDAYDGSRKQYEGSALISALPDLDGPVLGIIDEEIYTDGMNYIFGLASGDRALISLRRLHPEFYGSARDGDLLKTRALKEAMHELGHLFGLPHCPDRRCVMHFSSSIIDTDLKDWRYCGWCEGAYEVSA